MRRNTIITFVQFVLYLANAESPVPMLPKTSVNVSRVA